MALNMEYGDYKLHKTDAFELDHVIAYKKSLKFNSRNALMEVSQPRKFSPSKIIRYIYSILDITQCQGESGV